MGKKLSFAPRQERSRGSEEKCSAPHNVYPCHAVTMAREATSSLNKNLFLLSFATELVVLLDVLSKSDHGVQAPRWRIGGGGAYS